MTIRQLYDHVTARHGKILQPKIDKNKQVFEEGIDASKTLAIYICKQEACLETSVDANDPFSETTMVTTGTRHAVATGNMQLAWRDWVRIPNKTWNLWKTHWTQAFQEKRDLEILADVPINGVANAVTKQQMGNNMVTALDNLANAAVQKNDTIEALVIANKNLTDSLAAHDAKCAHLLSIITALSTGRNASVGGGGGGGGGGSGSGNDTKPPCARGGT